MWCPILIMHWINLFHFHHMYGQLFLLDFYEMKFLHLYIFINYLIIDNNTIIRICYFFQIIECIKWTIVLNVDISKVWSSYNIITVWCIQIIWFATVDVWVHTSKYTLLRNILNLPFLFPSWQRKLHIYLFYFCKILPQYNQNKTLRLRGRSILWALSINWSCDIYNDWLNCIYKIIDK